MRGDAKSMTVFSPRTAGEAVATYARIPNALPLAGGTDLMVSWNMGLLNGRPVLDLSRVSQWLSDSKKTKREPGAEYALLMQAWLNDPKRLAK